MEDGKPLSTIFDNTQRGFTTFTETPEGATWTERNRRMVYLQLNSFYIARDPLGLCALKYLV